MYTIDKLWLQLTNFRGFRICVRHDLSAIWAHLQPVFEKVARENPEIDSVFRFWWANVPVPMQVKFLHVGSKAIWTGNEACRLLILGGWSWERRCRWDRWSPQANRIVAQGADLPSAEAVFECLSRNTNVCLFYVTDSDVSRMDEYLNMVILRPIPGTMASHQLISLEKGQVYCQRLSCFCENLMCCPCFRPFKLQFPMRPVASTSTCILSHHSRHSWYIVINYWVSIIWCLYLLPFNSPLTIKKYNNLYSKCKPVFIAWCQNVLCKSLSKLRNWLPWSRQYCTVGLGMLQLFSLFPL